MEKNLENRMETGVIEGSIGLDTVDTNSAA